MTRPVLTQTSCSANNTKVEPLGPRAVFAQAIDMFGGFVCFIFRVVAIN